MRVVVIVAVTLIAVVGKVHSVIVSRIIVIIIVIVCPMKNIRHPPCDDINISFLTSLGE